MKKYKLALSYYLPSYLSMIVIIIFSFYFYIGTYKGAFNFVNFSIFLVLLTGINIPLLINFIYIKSTCYVIDDEGITEKTLFRNKKILWDDINFMILTNNTTVNRPGIDLLIKSKDNEEIAVHYQAYDFEEIYHTVLKGREELLKGPWTLSSIKPAMSDKKAAFIMAVSGLLMLGLLIFTYYKA
ncbi:MAG: hypothetical protein GX198_09010 [Epulopiscium sp.]|nr:hypothetical protein [Candidatus Epulonipiscium sp.]HOQ17378.1 hypothetical protein [Defluviitaleaceae bacterium]HPT77064.1 hypothetical protein [Defluviitaleaceae bacterium]